jgi:hypothetical protein
MRRLALRNPPRASRGGLREAVRDYNAAASLSLPASVAEGSGSRVYSIDMVVNMLGPSAGCSASQSMDIEVTTNWPVIAFLRSVVMQSLAQLPCQAETHVFRVNSGIGARATYSFRQLCAFALTFLVRLDVYAANMCHRAARRHPDLASLHCRSEAHLEKQPCPDYWYACSSS